MTKKPAHWMPFYVADSLADTVHLTVAQHGAYMLLILAYWRQGPLPDDDKMLARIARCDGRQWGQFVGATVREFFQPKGGKLHHKRIDLERAKAAAVSEARRQAALTLRPDGRESASQKDQEDDKAVYDIRDTAVSQNRDKAVQHSATDNVLNLLDTSKAIAEHLPNNSAHTRVARARAFTVTYKNT